MIWMIYEKYSMIRLFYFFQNLFPGFIYYFLYIIIELVGLDEYGKLVY